MNKVERGRGKSQHAYSISVRSDRSVLGSASWKQRVWFLRVGKPKGFVALSLTLCALHAAVLSLDTLSHVLMESNRHSSYPFTVALLMSHVGSFHWALLGTVYSVQSGIGRLWVLALLSLVLNFCVFVGRTWFELFVIKFREEIY